MNRRSTVPKLGAQIYKIKVSSKTFNPMKIGNLLESTGEQGGKCRDISAIYRRYIMYWETSTRYLEEKNHWKSAKKSSIYQHQAINRRFNGKKGSKRFFGRSMRVKALQCSRYSKLQCTRYNSALSKMPFFCATEGIQTLTQKVWGSAHQTTRASLPFVKCIALKIYIQSHHVKKILKENFREQINYNYFIIKYKNFF